MALIIRIDVDRPYGRQPLLRHVMSRLASDLDLPTPNVFGFLSELKQMLELMNSCGSRGYAFFRKCTMPSPSIIELMRQGNHEAGLHLENSRSFDTLRQEKNLLQAKLGRTIRSFSKHGSGVGKFGKHHHPAYEPEKYLDWAQRAGLDIFFGNLEDPTIEARRLDDVLFFPSAFWLEPAWRDSSRFDERWLMEIAPKRDVVMLVHPENVLASPELTASFSRLIKSLPSKLF